MELRNVKTSRSDPKLTYFRIHIQARENEYVDKKLSIQLLPYLRIHNILDLTCLVTKKRFEPLDLYVNI